MPAESGQGNDPGANSESSGPTSAAQAGVTWAAGRQRGCLKLLGANSAELTLALVMTARPALLTRRCRRCCSASRECRPGDRLFYPGNRIVHTRPQPKLSGLAAHQRAAAIRAHIEATVVCRAPQVMVKVTGGGRGMKTIAAHFRCICKNGRHNIEDDRDDISRGKAALYGLAEDWRHGGTFIDDIGDRREAYNLMLSMPRGTEPLVVQGVRRASSPMIGLNQALVELPMHRGQPFRPRRSSLCATAARCRSPTLSSDSLPVPRSSATAANQ